MHGTFAETESEAGVVPFKIDDETFQKTYMLVDGIYPKYSRFVGTVKHPITEEEKKNCKWQESSRKDIERVFGVLQNRWNAMERPIHTHKPERIPNMIASCLILHNMCGSERVMGCIGERYDPACGIYLEKETPAAFGEENASNKANAGSGGVGADCDTAISHFNPEMSRRMARKRHFLALDIRAEWRRLHKALQRLKGGNKSNQEDEL
jgi:Plant transposon protein